MQWKQQVSNTFGRRWRWQAKTGLDGKDWSVEEPSHDFKMFPIIIAESIVLEILLN